jgi:nitrogen fixation protein NifB
MAATHPCFDDIAHYRVFRIHLPVALKCNIKCKFCDRKIGVKYHAMRPGVSNQIIKPEEALNLVDAYLEKKRIKEVVIGIAGPGELLFNKETFQTLELIHSKYPDAQLCACTNGLLLDKYAQQLFTLGIKYITVTVNAISPIVGKNIYSWINFNNTRYEGIEAVKLLIEKQLVGVKKCVDLGMLTKVNSVLIPGINDFHLVEVSKKIKELGVYIHNIMPLIPLSDLVHIPAPTCELLRRVRNQSERILPIFRLCKQCRADACSIPGLE